MKSTHLEKKRDYKRTRKLGARLRDFCREMDLTPAELAKELGREPRIITDLWLNDYEQSQPDWTDLLIMREIAAEKQLPFDFYRLVDQVEELRVRLKVKDQPGIILRLAAVIYEFHGTVSRIEASVEEGRGTVEIDLEHPHYEEALLAAFRRVDGVDPEIEILSPTLQ